MDDREFSPNESVCPYCGVGCALQYDPRSGKALGRHGAVNTRGELCPKGVAAFEPVDHGDRLAAPLVREDGELRETTWADALGRIEDAFLEIRDRYGPDAAFFFASSKCTNEENYLLQRLARLYGTNNVDNCARLCHSSTVAALSERFGSGAATNTFGDLRGSDCFLVTGANPAENHPVMWRNTVVPAIAEGATLVHLDPRETPTTKAADVHLPVRPGYDVSALNALAAALVEADLVDREFVADRTRGLDDLTAFLADSDPTAEAARAGLDPGAVEAAARLYGEADRAAILTGMGLSQHASGTRTVHALVNLALLTGNVGRAGTGVNPLRGQNNVQGAGDVGALPDTLPGGDPVTDPDARARLADLWGDEPPETPGLTEVEATHRFGDDVRAAFVFGENPAVTEPNATMARERLDALDFLAVHDVVRTETTEHADVVLPGSSWAEKEGTVTNADRQVQRMRPNADLPGEARRDRSIVCELGRRLTDDPFDYETAEATFDELRRAVPQYAGMSYDGIGVGSQRWPFPPGADAGTDVLHRADFGTPDGRAEFRAVEQALPPDEVAEDDLVLTTGRVLAHYNSGALTRRSGTLVRLKPADALQIHPDDAAARDVADGDRIRVANDRGAVTATADVTPAVRPGTTFLTFHFAEPLTNALTGDELDPISKIPEYKHSAVRVGPADG